MESKFNNKQQHNVYVATYNVDSVFPALVLTLTSAFKASWITWVSTWTYKSWTSYWHWPIIGDIKLKVVKVAIDHQSVWNMN